MRKSTATLEIACFAQEIDGLKLLVKEPVLPNSANLVIFLFAPILTFLLVRRF